MLSYLPDTYRTDAGPRQRVIAWLGKLDEAGRLGVEQAAVNADPSSVNDSASSLCERQLSLFDQVVDDDDAPVGPQWVEVNVAGVRVENCRLFGGPWLALKVVQKLRLDEFLKRVMPSGREHVAWWRSALMRSHLRTTDRH